MLLPILHQRGHGLWIKSVMLTNSPHRYQILYKDNSFITLKLVIYSRGKKKTNNKWIIVDHNHQTTLPIVLLLCYKNILKKIYFFIFLFFSLFYINFFIFSYCFNILILKINIVLIYFQIKINLKNNHITKMNTGLKYIYPSPHFPYLYVNWYNYFFFISSIHPKFF